MPSTSEHPVVLEISLKSLCLESMCSMPEVLAVTLPLPTNIWLFRKCLVTCQLNIR